MISLIWSMDKNRLIGKKNHLPWRLPADLAYFKRITFGHTIIMGRKTFESIGKPLPGRTNVILTRDANYSFEGCTICHSVREALSFGANEEVFIIGGAEIYAKFLPFADRLYITQIEEEFVGDAFFPNIEFDSWTLVSIEKGEVNEKNLYDHSFMIYDKKNP